MSRANATYRSNVAPTGVPARGRGAVRAFWAVRRDAPTLLPGGVDVAELKDIVTTTIEQLAGMQRLSPGDAGIAASAELLGQLNRVLRASSPQTAFATMLAGTPALSRRGADPTLPEAVMSSVIDALTAMLDLAAGRAGSSLELGLAVRAARGTVTGLADRPLDVLPMTPAALGVLEAVRRGNEQGYLGREGHGVDIAMATGPGGPLRDQIRWVDDALALERTLEGILARGAERKDVSAAAALLAECMATTTASADYLHHLETAVLRWGNRLHEHFEPFGDAHLNAAAVSITRGLDQILRRARPLLERTRLPAGAGIDGSLPFAAHIDSLSLEQLNARLRHAAVFARKAGSATCVDDLRIVRATLGYSLALVVASAQSLNVFDADKQIAVDVVERYRRLFGA